MKNSESIERRRNEVSLETEQNLSKTRHELERLQRELIFITNNRNDIEVALKASQVEREMLERELLCLRH